MKKSPTFVDNASIQFTHAVKITVNHAFTAKFSIKFSKRFFPSFMKNVMLISCPLWSLTYIVDKNKTWILLKIPLLAVSHPRWSGDYCRSKPDNRETSSHGRISFRGYRTTSVHVFIRRLSVYILNLY